ncbi:MAG: phosphomannomutase [Myxococcota bacterium]|jgi:phosphomannomutase|nr:phosphomannomutase [Myxococcota bacterium]
MSDKITCFKAYDVRGRIPDELNEDIAYRIGRAYAAFVSPGKVVVGHDIRLTSESISNALIEGLRDSGVDVLHIGVCGTEEVYFATFHYQIDGGIAVTASHNPKDYNGMKFVRAESRPISADTGLMDIRNLAENNAFEKLETRGSLERLEHRPAYIEHLLGYIDTSKCRPLRIVTNPGNGGAGGVVDALDAALPFEFIRMHHEPDGNFPNGVPNPLLVENRAPTIDKIAETKADLGIAWDGDFDRCFFFDELGQFIEGYYIVGLLASAFLDKQPGQKIVHDPRLTWNTLDIVADKGGVAVESKSGHAFIKERMREVDGVYGGEMSAHHYFRDFSYCDSGMIPWLLVTELMSTTGKPLSTLVQERIDLYPASGEINRRLEDAPKSIAAVRAAYEPQANSSDDLDGLSLEFDDWRFNLRSSNTEPVVRLNVESRGDAELMREKTEAILELLGGEPA